MIYFYFLFLNYELQISLTLSFHNLFISNHTFFFIFSSKGRFFIYMKNKKINVYEQYNIGDEKLTQFLLLEDLTNKCPWFDYQIDVGTEITPSSTAESWMECATQCFETSNCLVKLGLRLIFLCNLTFKIS